MPEPTYYWICRSCGWKYASEEGDIPTGTEPGTDFQSLPINYCCPRCGSDKSNFDREHTYDW